MELAEFLYGAWVSEVDGDTGTGQPPWDNLLPAVQDAWQAMAMLVGTYHGPPPSNG